MKALSVFSGGLDSLLASELIRAQGIDVLALFFETPFFRSQNARRFASLMSLPLRVVDITDSHLAMVAAPKHGYGENMNPCIDCHALMIRTAGDLLEEEGACFIITGEVLGQRPMSQNRKALSIVESESGYTGRVLRPLCAKRLPPTIPENEGWVDREALKGFSGRSRKPQIALARELGIRDYPSPAGGCLLTDQTFSTRLRDLFKAHPYPLIRDIEALKVGRHFRLGPSRKAIVGRNQKENQTLQALAGRDDTILRSVGVPGPTVLVPGGGSSKEIYTAAAIGAAYSDTGEKERAEIHIHGRDGEETLAIAPRDKAKFRDLMI
ncbi:MAG: tRNA 4-thiouridine(8) synthase ThiI [Thermodesulfobacteriota bacterium]